MRLTGHRLVPTLRMSGAPPVLRHMPFGMYRCNCREVRCGDSREGENRERDCVWIRVADCGIHCYDSYLQTCGTFRLSDCLPCFEEALNPDVVSSGCHVGSSEERALFCRVSPLARGPTELTALCCSSRVDRILLTRENRRTRKTPIPVPLTE